MKAYTIQDDHGQTVGSFYTHEHGSSHVWFQGRVYRAVPDENYDPVRGVWVQTTGKESACQAQS